MKDLEEKAEEARAKLEELAATLSPRQTELERGINQLDQDFQDTAKHNQASIAEMEAKFDSLH